MKNKRQQAILDLISSNFVDTQEELLRLLKDSGFSVTQATVSRDIKELQLIKSLDSDGRYKYISRPEQSPLNNYRTILKSSVISIDYAMNDVVVKCYSGMASAACAAIDSMDIPDVIGTVSGDDTLLIIAKSEEKAAEIVKYFYKLLEK